MCHYKNTIFSCGCQIGENTLVCGYVNDDLAQCMADTRADEVLVPRVCGRQCCSSSPFRESNLKTQDNRKINHSDDECSERSVETPEL